MKLSIALGSVALAWGFTASPVWADATGDVAALRSEWDTVNFTLKKDDQVKPLEVLIEKAAAVNRANPGHAPALIWEGIIHATYAGAKGGLGALRECKTAKALFEQAMEVDPAALNGAAYTSVGSLYYQVPGWPIGFGNDEKAEEMLKKGIVLGPQDLDAHYFYGDFLIRQQRWQEAVDVLQAGLLTPADPQRPLFQQGRREEMNRLLATAKSSM
jgi:tetratricopeptide (TPR) repeat protein